MAVADKVKGIIVEQLGVDEEEVTPDASFVDDFGADSLDTVELVMAFEEEFGIDIPDEDAEQMRTVGDAVSYLKKHSAGSGGSWSRGWESSPPWATTSRPHGRRSSPARAAVRASASSRRPRISPPGS